MITPRGGTMQTIEIKTQAEFDALPDTFQSYTKIRVTGKLQQIARTFINAEINVSGSASIQHVSGSASIKHVYESASVQDVYGSASIQHVYGSASIQDVSGSASIQDVSESASIQDVSGSASIKRVYGSASIKHVSESASIQDVSGSASIQHVSMNAIIRISGDSVQISEARQSVVLIYQGCQGQPQHQDDAVIVNRTKIADFTLEIFIKTYDVQQADGKLILYKSVRDDYTDFYSGTVKYEPGTVVECRDWDPSPDRECGSGLHLSPSIEHCKRFRAGKYMRCEVAIADILVHKRPQYPYKVRCKRVFVVGEVHENTEAA